MIGGAKGIGIGIDFGIPNQYCRATSKPYIEKDVLDSLRVVASAYGKSNNDADRSIVKNLVDASNPFVISNAAFKLNSGFGKYEDDFTNWVAETGTKLTSDKITNSNPTKNWIAYRSSGVEFKEMHIRILGIPDNGVLYFQRPAADGGPIRMFNGDNNIPAFTSTGICGFFINNLTGLGWSNLVIEQIPSFQGAFVTDGIDDLITSTKTVQEMLGGSNEITVVSMIHQIGFISSRNYARNNYFIQGNDFLTNTISAIGKIGIYGYKGNLSNIAIVNDILGDKKDYSVDKANPTNIDSVFSVNGTHSSAQLSQVAWYWTIIANKELTTDQINQVIAYFNLDRTLNPDIRCNIERQGITNDNHADFNDKLADYSGNGRDIQMYNLAWKGGSGIAAKQYETFKDWTSESSSTSIITQIDEFTRIVESTTNGYWVSRIRRDSDLNKVYDAINVYLYQDNNFLVHECKYEVDGVKYAIPINEPVGKGYHKLEMYTKDRYTELPENAENVILSEWYFPKSNKGSIKYSVIPSYKGGILLDGINDFGKVTRMPIYKDYTFIIDREIISIGNTNGIVASKSEDSKDVNKQGAFLFEYLGNPNNVSAWSFYKDNGKVANTDFTRGISYQSKYSYNGIELLAGTAFDSDKLWLGTLRDKDSRFANVAIYSLMSFPYSMSKFLIERQLKKYKLGTLYPNMVEFRPVIKSSVELVNKPTFAIRGTSTLLNAGDYIPENSEIWVVITMNNAADRITKFVINGNTIDIPSSAYNPSTMKYGFPFTIDSKSPQKITMTIEQDENYVKWNPIVESNVEYAYISYLLRIPGQGTVTPVIGQYYPILSTDTSLVVYVATNGVDEVANLTINGQEPTSSSIHVDGRFKFEFPFNNSPQKINITIDEYIRYEDIKQPYPVIFQIKDRNTSKKYNWGDKIKVGSSIQLSQGENPNLLNGLYSVQSYEYEGETYTYNQLKALVIIITKSGIQLSCNKVWTFDDNEPKCILSPRLLRIPNSSYKILGYIPDISGHGNNGVINNSAYAEGSGVNEDGSYQFDGVDDFITIPTTVGGKQVLMKVNSRKSDCYLYDQRNDWTQYLGIVSTKDFIAYNYSNQRGKTYIDGILNENITANDLIGITHNITVTNNRNDVKQYSPCIGTSFARNSYAQMALYDFMLFDKISTDDKIKELNEYVGIEGNVWGILTQLSNSTLISNETLIKNE